MEEGSRFRELAVSSQALACSFSVQSPTLATTLSNPLVVVTSDSVV